jgi:hypothetical protein
MSRTTATARAMSSRARAASSAPGQWAAAGATASRLLIVLVAAAATAWLPVKAVSRSFLAPAGAGVFHGMAARLAVPWTHWDGAWFLRVALRGYRHDASPAFFPLYPLLIRGLAPLTGGNYVLAGMAVSLVAYAAAMILLYRLVAGDVGRRVALWSVVFLSLFPTAFFFQAVYSESLFLALTLAALLAARRGRWWLAGLLGGLATLTRSAGVLLLVPLAWMWWEQRRGAALRLPGGRAGGKHGGQRERQEERLAVDGLKEEGRREEREKHDRPEGDSAADVTGHEPVEQDHRGRVGDERDGHAGEDVLAPGERREAADQQRVEGKERGARVMAIPAQSNAQKPGAVPVGPRDGEADR